MTNNPLNSERLPSITIAEMIMTFPVSLHKTRRCCLQRIDGQFAEDNGFLSRNNRLLS